MENTDLSDQYCALDESGGLAGILSAVLRYGKSLRRGSDGAVGAGGRQEYAAVLLSMATDTTARRIFAAPVCFDEGDIRGRIRHILKCRKTAGKLAALAVELCVVVALILLTQKVP